MASFNLILFDYPRAFMLANKLFNCSNNNIICLYIEIRLMRAVIFYLFFYESMYIHVLGLDGV